TPWYASERAVRNRYPSSSSVVITGDVEAGEICGILFGLLTLRAIGIVTPLDRAPTKATAPSTVASLLAASTPACGLVWASPTMILIGCPRTPPAALISLAASLTPLSEVGP